MNKDYLEQHEEEPEIIFPLDEEEVPDIVAKEEEIDLEKLRRMAKEIGYPHYKNAKEKKLTAVLEAHNDNQN